MSVIRKLIVSCVGCGVVFLWGVVGCSDGIDVGGKTASTGYSCPVTGTHCYATTNIVPPSGASGLTGFQTQIALNHRAKPGDGFFTREFWLHSFACFCWIEMGIADTLVPGSSGLFWSEQYMTQGGGPSAVATIGSARWIGPITSADGSSARFAAIYQGGNQFNILIDPEKVPYRTTRTNPMWDYRGPGYIADRGFVTMGSELAGTSGASSTLVFFQGNRTFSAPTTSTFLVFSGTGDRFDQPPYGGWFSQPSAGTDGGVFFTECCAPIGQAAGSNSTAVLAGMQSQGSGVAEEPPDMLDEALLDRPAVEPAGISAVALQLAARLPPSRLMTLPTG